MCAPHFGNVDDLSAPRGLSGLDDVVSLGLLACYSYSLDCNDLILLECVFRPAVGLLTMLCNE